MSPYAPMRCRRSGPRRPGREAARFGIDVAEDDKGARWDLRALPLVTIDGEDAQDFDDAVHCAPTDKGWRLIVAIADVAHYVRPDSALDAEARRRGTSVYFPGRVLPMLPEALSNGLCSLRPDEDRLCMACGMFIDREGRILRSRFREALMRSHARLVYEEVASHLGAPPRGDGARLGVKLENLRHLHALFRVLHHARRRRGALDLDTPEIRMLLDDTGEVSALEAHPRNDAHRLIEECMIARQRGRGEISLPPPPALSLPGARGTDNGKGTGVARLPSLLWACVWAVENDRNRRTMRASSNGAGRAPTRISSTPFSCALSRRRSILRRTAATLDSLSPLIPTSPRPSGAIPI